MTNNEKRFIKVNKEGMVVMDTTTAITLRQAESLYNLIDILSMEKPSYEVAITKEKWDEINNAINSVIGNKSEYTVSSSDFRSMLYAMVVIDTLIDNAVEYLPKEEDNRVLINKGLEVTVLFSTTAYETLEGKTSEWLQKVYKNGISWMDMLPYND